MTGLYSAKQRLTYTFAVSQYLENSGQIVQHFLLIDYYNYIKCPVDFIKARIAVLLLIVASSLNAQTDFSQYEAEAVVVTGDTSSTVQSIQPRKKLIFLDFANRNKSPDYQFIESSIGDSMHELVQDKYEYDRIPREAWEAEAKKMGLKNEDYENKKKIALLARNLGADGIIYGSFFINDKNVIEAEGIILSAIDEKIVARRNITSTPDNELFNQLQNLSENLAAKIKDLFYPTDNGALWRSAVAPGWGLLYKQQEEWGYTYITLFALSFVYSAYSLYAYDDAIQDYLNFTPKHVITPEGETALYDPEGAARDFADLETKIESTRENLFVSLYILGGVYTASLIHSYFMPPDTGNVTVKAAFAPALFQNPFAGNFAPGYAFTFSAVYTLE